jgi:hypothetical protein
MNAENPCPDCGGDPADPGLHRPDCPRLDTGLQFGPPWYPLPSTEDKARKPRKKRAACHACGRPLPTPVPLGPPAVTA